MNNFKKALRYTASIFALVLLCSYLAFAQQGRGTLRGLVTDELGAAVVGASVVLNDLNGVQKAATTTNGEGVYVFNGVQPGKYLVTASAEGFAPSDAAEVDLVTGQRKTQDLMLRVTFEEKVTVAAETPLSTDSTSNANQTVISGKDLDALPDDPDELAAALQALAGPQVGPNGGQIFIDGFSGGRLPPKESIREIRINQNPFAAENDQPSGRVDILTRPGTDKLRGSAFFNFEDEALNSRNPFSESRTPFQIRQFGGNLAGPLVAKKASFFVDFQRRATDDNELVRGTQLDANLQPDEFGFGVVAPRYNTSFSPRFDYQLNANNTLIGRYSYTRNRSENNGVGGFSLPERGYDAAFSQHQIQITETAVLNASMINETRFQFTRNRSENFGDNTIPVLNVSGAFVSGGSQIGQTFNNNQSFELTNFLAWQKGTHAFKFGGRVRHVSIDDSSPNNYGGSWVFTGALVPTLDANNNPIFDQPIFVDSLERYRRTVLGNQLGLTPLQIRAIGGNPSQFSLATGNPLAGVSQTDLGVYAQDDWRIRPNLTLSYGLRYENQTNINSNWNIAPRAAFAWSPGAANSTRPPSMVIRGGAGIFYNRFNENQTLQANRFNGVNQQQFFVTERPLYVNGAFVPPIPSVLDVFDPNNLNQIPPANALTLDARQITWRVAEELDNPRVYLAGVQVERQLPKRFTATVGFYSIHIRNVIRAQDINAPLPGTITALNPGGTRPFGNIGDIYEYQANGRFDQNQLFIALNSRFNRMFSFNANYSISKTENDTDGQGGAMFSANPYDITGEYGRAAFDIRHRFNFFGTINLPWWQVSLNPFVSATSGRPFNITTGQDTNLDRQFTERPAFAPAGATCSGDIICTQFGNFNRNPAPGEALIPRNYGEGPGYFSVNLRVTKTWSFGTMRSANAAAGGGQGQTAGGDRGQGQAGGGGRGGGGARMIPNAGGGGGGGPVRAGGGGGGIPGLAPPSSGAAEAKRYTMQFSINFSNIFNRVNLSTPVGNLSSPSFGESLALGFPFGNFGPFGGGGGSAGAGNRRISAQVRFSF